MTDDFVNFKSMVLIARTYIDGIQRYISGPEIRKSVETLGGDVSYLDDILKSISEADDSLTDLDISTSLHASIEK